VHSPVWLNLRAAAHHRRTARGKRPRSPGPRNTSNNSLGQSAFFSGRSGVEYYAGRKTSPFRDSGGHPDRPFEVLPVYLKLLQGKDVKTHRQIAWKSCVYALLLSFFFLIFGTLILRLFGVPLSMVRIVGGIILMKIGFELFSPSPAGGGIIPAGGAEKDANIAFVPPAMPLMFGPGAIATILGMTSTIKQSSTELASFAAVVAAILATMFVTYLCLAYASKLSEKLGPLGIDAITRIVGFFVSAIGVALIFDGVIEALETHGITTLH
jgi:multiple antibiotic resistance protein